MGQIRMVWPIVFGAPEEIRTPAPVVHMGTPQAINFIYKQSLTALAIFNFNPIQPQFPCAQFYFRHKGTILATTYLMFR